MRVVSSTKGQMGIAAERLGLDTSIAKSQIDLAEKYYGMDSDKFVEAKRAAKVMEGYTGQQLADARSQFSANFGLEHDKFVADSQKWREEFDQGIVQWAASNKNAETALGLDAKRLAEATRASMAMEKLQGDQLAAAKDQFSKTFGLDVQRFDAAKTQWQSEFTQSNNQWLLSRSDSQNQFNRTLEAEENRLEHQRWVDEQQLGEGGFTDRALKLTEASAEADNYWNGSDKFSSSVATHLDWAKISKPSDLDANPGALDEAVAWYTAKYNKPPQDKNSETFKKWAVGEIQAASDSRLTNPYDATAHAIDSSTSLSADEKLIWKAALADPKTYGIDFVIETAADGTKTVKAGESTTGSTAPVAGSAKDPNVVYVNSENDLTANPILNRSGANTWESPTLNSALSSGKKISVGGKMYTVTGKSKDKVWGENNSNYTLLGEDGTTKTIKVSKAVATKA
jgi:hypothetical protein